ncbi:hypothetical protein AC15_0909 [Escherichia coli 2-156-04_S3_C2]|nr:hypothetical protein AC15_0909 [Escherichia coli 2-156-04_S3_C2]
MNPISVTVSRCFFSTLRQMLLMLLSGDSHRACIMYKF